ncbi:hypothetical protein KMW28_13530 [Flammeovirga yaeyamensis]|uniref:Lipoprotein n=1 Tax=Flammeovirga yaeyamensis TaxID=367791 RepID=A0AAX1MZL3_9BACT|nr:hypothetical protein [Flammeovirga yaeyamensis]MBB3700914.1 hypothetical protein [Flammeovirga yaeyamensis]NMF38022.1 hypothetical protein [Flammeovirga yaeyamensis]QWG00672.1 hypothetical protein KMW28_13530 [Flammeovirga yaeyamensis]
MKKVLLIFLLGLFAMSCSEDEEPAPCDTQQTIADLTAVYEKLGNLPDDATCEDTKAAAQEALDFANANETCINEALEESFADDPDGLADAQQELEETKALLEVVTLLPCDL